MNILLGVSGSVAATLTNKLEESFKNIGKVKVVATKSAEHFIPESVSYYKEEDEWQWKQRGDIIPHIYLRNWADILVLCPLTANTLSKISAGNADNILTNTVRAWDYQKLMVLCPVMNPVMWHNPFTKRQLDVMRALTAHVIFPVEKKMMCGEIGIGAMPRIEDIVFITQQEYEARKLISKPKSVARSKIN